MAVGIVMPKAGITVEECMITKWMKSVGDTVAVGDVLFSYETDKAAFECESTASGELLAVFFEEGDEVPVLVNVCAVGEKGEDFSELQESSGKSQEAGSVGRDAPSTPEAAKSAESAPAENAPESGAIKISPRAKNLAGRLGADVSAVNPTGPYGRIIERDVRAVMASRGLGGQVAAPQTPPESTVFGEYEDAAMPKIRRIIAKAMGESLSQIPQLTHHHAFDAANILELRKTFKADGVNITLNDMALYAVSRVLPRHPDFNAHLIDGQTVRRFKNVHLGIAIDTPRGLMVPVLRDADRKSLSEIAVEAKLLAKQAQDGSVNPDLLTGGTFTVSNLGVLGVEMFTPVIYPPQTAILGVCNITIRLKMMNGEPKPYQAMGLSVTYDHRVIDGAPEARFAADLCAFLENCIENIEE
ncbi:MAG: 2-oxo acid dehydrogenase subunit E2 [Oscillospiraceae bacterium]|nr:2-oxo acid dehydrogenase subunit E2 [Oscillospiraceae bacterium]